MRRTCVLLCLALLFVLPLSAQAIDMRVTSSTQYSWFNDILTGNDDEMFAEYLRMSITKLNPENTISIQGYGRGTYRSADAEGTDDLLGRVVLCAATVMWSERRRYRGRHYINLPPDQP
jgi:hypothetical protein